MIKKGVIRKRLTTSCPIACEVQFNVSLEYVSGVNNPKQLATIINIAKGNDNVNIILLLLFLIIFRFPYKHYSAESEKFINIFRYQV